MIVNTMNNHQNQKQGILSFMGGLGVIILIAGIFLPSIEFTYALYVAISLWMLTAVIGKFMGINRHGEFLDTNWKDGLVTLLGVLGAMILFAGIFLNVPFSYALVVAIIFWVMSGVVASFLGVENNKKQKYYKVPNGIQYSSGSLPNDINYRYSSNDYGNPSSKVTTSSANTSSIVCRNCGSPMYQSDTFCSECGFSSKIS